MQVSRLKSLCFPQIMWQEHIASYSPVFLTLPSCFHQFFLQKVSLHNKPTMTKTFLKFVAEWLSLHRSRVVSFHPKHSFCKPSFYISTLLCIWSERPVSDKCIHLRLSSIATWPNSTRAKSVATDSFFLSTKLFLHTNLVSVAALLFPLKFAVNLLSSSHSVQNLSSFSADTLASSSTLQQRRLCCCIKCVAHCK